MFAGLVILIIDAAVLAALLLILGKNRLRQAPRAGLVGLGLALTWLVCDLLLRWLFGFLIVVPLTILTGVILKVYGRLRAKQAALAAAIFLVLRVVLGTIVPWLL
jgi:hypothetical protein